jgi:hypothetical protein
VTLDTWSLLDRRHPGRIGSIAQSSSPCPKRCSALLLVTCPLAPVIRVSGRSFSFRPCGPIKIGPCFASTFSEFRNMRRCNHDISIVLLWIYLLIVSLLFSIILQDNRFVRNLFKRLKSIHKVAAHRAGRGTSQLAGPEPSQLARKRTPCQFSQPFGDLF